MRVLVAGRNAKVLAKTASAFANDLQIETAATKAASFALLERTEFDLIVACETLGDGSGLEVLSHVAVNAPNTLRIFAARPSTLNLLKGELGLFGLYRTLPYPINFRKLWAALSLARSTCADGQPARAGNRVGHVVLEEGWKPARAAPAANGQSVPQVAVQRQAAAVGRAAAKQAAPAAARTATAASASIPVPQATRRPDTSGIRAAARYAAAHGEAAQSGAATAQMRAPAASPSASTRSRQAASVPKPAATASVAPARPTSRPQRHAASARKPAPIPQNETFRRALAKRNAAKLEANSQFGPTDQIHATSQILGISRREPGMTNDSLAQLAKLATAQRSPYSLRGAPAGKKRAALFVGSGVFAATTAAVLTFFMMNANNSIDRSKWPLLASVNRPAPNNAFPWQPRAQQPTRPTTFIRSESTATAAADLEVEAEAASENFEIEPGHPGPPQPNPPPPASEPPSLESPAVPVDDE
jgi:hypothetical protein